MPDSLAKLFEEPLDSVMHRERHALEGLLRSRNNRVVLYGAGNLGRQAASALREIDIKPLAFSDNNCERWGTQVCELDVLEPKEAAALYGDNSTFLITIWNEFHWFQETATQLSAYEGDGFQTVMYAVPPERVLLST